MSGLLSIGVPICKNAKLVVKLRKTIDRINPVEEWESTGKISRSLARAAELQLGSLISRELDKAATLADKYPDAALAQFVRLVLFLNAVATTRPWLGGQFLYWIYRFESVFNKLARNLGARSFTIGVSSQTGLYVDLNFPVD